MFRTILVPLDGSEVSASILEQVVALARSNGARLLLLTVGLPLPTWFTHASDIQGTLTFQAEAYLERVRVHLEAQGLEVTTMVCIGEPACAILDVAAQQQVDLIVINSRGGGGCPCRFWGVWPKGRRRCRPGLGAACPGRQHRDPRGPLLTWSWCYRVLVGAKGCPTSGGKTMRLHMSNGGPHGNDSVVLIGCSWHSSALGSLLRRVKRCYRLSMLMLPERLRTRSRPWA